MTIEKCGVIFVKEIVLPILYSSSGYCYHFVCFSEITCCRAKLGTANMFCIKICQEKIYLRFHQGFWQYLSLFISLNQFFITINSADSSEAIPCFWSVSKKTKLSSHFEYKKSKPSVHCTLIKIQTVLEAIAIKRYETVLSNCPVICQTMKLNWMKNETDIWFL